MARSLSRLVFLLLWVAVHGSSLENDNLQCTSEVDPISCMLGEIVLGPLAPICLDAGGGDAVCLNHLICADIALLGLPSWYDAPTAYVLGLTELGASCSGDWVLGDSSGSLTALLTDFTSKFGVTFVKEDLGQGVLAEDITLKECNVTKANIALHFSGRDVGTVKILNGLADQLAELLELSIARLICGPIAADAVDALTAVLVNKINPKLVELMSFGPSVPPIIPDTVNWHETPLEVIHMLTSLLQTNSDAIHQCIAAAAPALRSENSELSLHGIGEFLLLDSITIPINMNIEMSSDASIYFELLTLSGLDTMQDLLILSPVVDSNITLSSRLRIQTLNISMAMAVTIGSYTEAVTLSTVFMNSTMLLDVVLGVNQSGLNNLFLDQLVNMGCLQNLVQELSVSSLLMDVDLKQLDYIQVAGDAGPLEFDTVAAVQNFINLALDGFPELVHDTLIGLAQGPIRAAINDVLAERLDYFSRRTACPAHIEHDSETPNWIQWNSSVLIKTLDLFLDTILGAEGLNSFFSCATGGTGVIKFTPRPEMLITLSGLTSFYDFSVLLPVVYEPYELYNGIGLGYCPADNSTPCTPFEIDLKFNIEEDPGDLAVSFHNIQIILGLFLEVDLNEIYNLQFGDWSRKGCRMSTVDDMHLYDLQMSSSYSELFLLGDTNRNITTLMNKLFARLTSVANIANINDRMEKYIDNADYVCTESANPNDVSDDDDEINSNTEWHIYVFVVGTLLTVAVIAYIHYCFSIRNEKSLWNVLLSGENIVKALYPAEYEHYRFDEAIIFHKHIPLFWRLVIPVIVFGLMGLIFSSNMTMAVDVMLEIDIGTEVFTPPAIFSYGLGNTIKDMWNAEVYALSILVAFFSGAWPYVKLFAMLLCWVLPPGVLTLWWREHVLEWLDILGKWSILDAYVMTLLMVAFHMTVNLEEPVVAIVTVKPRYGFYSFVAATMGSLVIGHLGVLVHHYVVGNKRAMDTAGLAWNNEPTMNHEFIVPSRQSKIRFTLLGKSLVILFIMSTGLLVFAGCYMKTFEVHIRGLVGYLIDMKDNPITDYSLLDVGAELPAASGVPDTLGARWIQASFYVFAFIMPLCLQVSLLLLWVFPLSLKWQQRLFFVAEVFNAWSAIDVFCVSIVAVLLEIQDFAAFIVGDSCSIINDVLAQYFDEEMQGDDKCFDVTARILPQSWATCAAAFLLIVVELPILLMCKMILEERLRLNGVLIESSSATDEVCDPLLEPLIAEPLKVAAKSPLRNKGDDTVNGISRIGGSSNSDCSDVHGGRWVDGTSVEENETGLWDTSSSGEIRSDGAYSRRVIDDQTEMFFEGSQKSDPELQDTIVTAHGVNRTIGQGGNGSSGGSRGALASVDLTDAPFLNSTENNSFLYSASVVEKKSAGDEIRGSRFSSLVGSIAPAWTNVKQSNGGMRESNLSVSTSTSGTSDYENKETMSNRIIGTLLVLHIISEEQIF